jgi:dihydroflavonol-4-reductase
VRAGRPAPITRRVPRSVVRTVAWLSERYAAVTREEPYITVKAAEYAAHRAWFDNGKARRDLGMPKTPLRETIDKAIRWFRDNGYA